MLELLTGTGLSASAGLKAWIPLLVAGLTARYTDLLDPPPTWDWLSSGWGLSAIAVLLVTEVLADKVPALDSVNDTVYTVVRPGAGGVAFGAAYSTDAAAGSGDPSAGQWIPVAVGAVLALGVHLLKVLTRLVANTMTFGFAAPVLSTVEDAVSGFMSLAAILAPVLVIGFLLGLTGVAWWVVRRRARARKATAGSDTTGDAAPA